MQKVQLWQELCIPNDKQVNFWFNCSWHTISPEKHTSVECWKMLLCICLCIVHYANKMHQQNSEKLQRLGLRMECDSAWQLDRKLLILSIPNSIPWILSSHEKVSPFWSIWMPLRMNSLSHTSPLNSGRQSHVHESGSRVPPFWHIRMQAVCIQRMNFELITIKCYDHMWIQHRHTWKTIYQSTSS